MFHPPLPPQEGGLSCDVAVEKGQTHTPYFSWPCPYRAPRHRFPCCSLLCSSQPLRSQEQTLLVWVTEFFGLCIYFSRLLWSLFAVFSFLLLKTKIISKPVQGCISLSLNRIPCPPALRGEELCLQPRLEPEGPLLTEHEKELGVTYPRNVPACSYRDSQENQPVASVSSP